MDTLPVLYKLYTKDIEEFLLKPFRQLVLPTEVILRNSIPTPRYARAYKNLDLFVRFGSTNVVWREDLCRNPPADFKGIHTIANSVHLLEYFVNEGDDGHTDMVLNGWIFVPDNALTDDLYYNPSNHRFNAGSLWEKVFPLESYVK